MRKYTIHQLTPSEVSKDAFDVYSNSDFVIFKENDRDCYLIAFNNIEKPFVVGNIKDLDDYLLCLV